MAWTPPSDAVEVSQTEPTSGWVPPSDADIGYVSTDQGPGFDKLAGRSKALAKGIVENVIPATTGFVGGLVGGAPGTLLENPPVALAGAAGGGMAGYEAGQKLNEFISNQIPPETKRIFGFDKETRARERANYPIMSGLADYAPDVALGAKGLGDMFKGTFKFAADRAIRNAAPEQQRLLPVASEWGLQLKPQQLRSTGDREVLGNANNQKIINQKVAEATGVENPENVRAIDRRFVQQRFEDLSKQYDDIYSRGPVTLPKNLIADIETIKQDPIAKLGAVEKKALDALVSPLKSDPLLTGAPQPVDGKTFQNAVSKLKTVIRESNDPEQRRQVLGMIDNLNKALESNNPQIAEELSKLNPKFRATATLDNIHYSNNNAVDTLGNVDAYELGTYLRTNKNEANTNPLKEIGEVGEALGIGANRSGTRYVRRATQNREFLPNQSKLNLLSRMSRAATDYDVTKAAAGKDGLKSFVSGVASETPLTFDMVFGKNK